MLRAGLVGGVVLGLWGAGLATAAEDRGVMTLECRILDAPRSGTVEVLELRFGHGQTLRLELPPQHVRIVRVPAGQAEEYLTDPFANGTTVNTLADPFTASDSARAFSPNELMDPFE